MCTTGSWDNPICEADACALDFTTPHIGTAGGADTASGDTHTFECADGYSPTGVATCTTGWWDSPICEGEISDNSRQTEAQERVEQEVGEGTHLVSDGYEMSSHVPIITAALEGGVRRLENQYQANDRPPQPILSVGIEETEPGGKIDLTLDEYQTSVRSSGVARKVEEEQSEEEEEEEEKLKDVFVERLQMSDRPTRGAVAAEEVDNKEETHPVKDQIQLSGRLPKMATEVEEEEEEEGGKEEEAGEARDLITDAVQTGHSSTLLFGGHFSIIAKALQEGTFRLV